MSCLMADLFNLSKDHIKRDLSANMQSNAPTTRPNNSQLDTTYTYNKLDFKTIMNFENSIKECLEFSSS
jgi:hypothetical protein